MSNGAERIYFSFLQPKTAFQDPFPSQDLSHVFKPVMCLFNNLAMIRRTSAHLSDRAKVPVDFWFRHIDDDHAQLE